MKGKLPNQIPPGGVRYDFTLEKAGLDKYKREIAHFLIDSGDFKGHRVSQILNPATKKGIIVATGIRSDETNNQTFHGLHAGKLRISGVLGVTRSATGPKGMRRIVSEAYKDSDVIVTYSITEIDPPSGQSELTQKAGNQFKRKAKPVTKPQVEEAEVVEPTEPPPAEETNESGETDIERDGE